MNGGNTGIYVHIPFCEKKCGYCDFYSLSGADKQLMDRYASALITHMNESAKFMGRAAGSGAATIDTVYFGGGTPTMLGGARLSKMLTNLRKRFNVTSSAEITLEANPGTVDRKMLVKLRKAGFNRISFGVQAIEPKLLEKLGRIHNAEQAAQSVREAFNAGFNNVSVDLMYGIPGQTSHEVAEAIETVVSWGVTHISLYGLKLEEGTKLFLEMPALPSDEEQAEVYLSSVEQLKDHGFEQYEISNFARGGYICRHNYKYWTLEPYVGFGPAAHSDFGSRRYSYVPDVQEYINGVRDSDAIIDDMQHIPIVERASEYIMLGLRTTRGISSNEYTRLFKASFDTLEHKLEKCAKWKLCEMVGDRWHLTPNGFLVSNRIIAELLETRSI